jgi:ketosteroid isomerase-like protein
MATNLDPDGMRALVAEHSDAELRGDWAAALATMTSEPFYEFYPNRLRISGGDAIATMWPRLFALPCFGTEDTTPLSLEEYVGDDGLMHTMAWIFTGADGEHLPTQVATRYAFEGDRMRSETMFMDTSGAPYVAQAFDAAFRALPGVEQI